MRPLFLGSHGRPTERIWAGGWRAFRLHGVPRRRRFQCVRRGSLARPARIVRRKSSNTRSEDQVAYYRRPVRVQQVYQRHCALPEHVERNVEPSQREQNPGQRQAAGARAAAQRQGEDAAQQAVEQQVERQTRERLCAEIAAHGVAAIEDRGEEIFRIPEAPILPRGADSEPCQHPKRSHHSSLQPGQHRGKRGGDPRIRGIFHNSAYTGEWDKGKAQLIRRVAITGIGAVSPNGIGRERFWKATRNGVSGVRRIRRFDPSPFVVQVAGEVPEEFDEKLYVDVKDRPHVSRAVPLAVASVGEAVSDAGLDVTAMSRDELRGIGVIVGSGGGSQDFTEEQYRLFYTGHLKQCSVYTIPTGTIGTLASEVSMRFGFRGFSHIISTGCTSSTDALGYAYRNIQMGVLNTMIAGGVDSPIAPLILRGFQLMRIMSTRWNAEPERASRPFSRDRDGFVIAEGAWFFVLEEMERAKARGAHIYGEIAGYGSTCEAYHRVRLEECGEEPARAIGLAMEEGGIGPGDVQYVNYHGTATELNDRIETRAMKLAFNGHAYKLAGSSLKSLIGHPQGACGAAGIAATLLAMRDGVVHPTINVEEPDPQCDLDYIPDVARRMDIEHAVSNCIAFGSKNSALLLRRI